MGEFVPMQEEQAMWTEGLMNPKENGLDNLMHCPGASMHPCRETRYMDDPASRV